LLPGAYASQMITDFGPISQVEEPGSGDCGRVMPPQGPGGMSLYFTAINRNKRSITLNLKSEEGPQHFFLRLVHDADVVLEAFRSGVMGGGLGYEQLEIFWLGYIYIARSAAMGRMVPVACARGIG